jgi:hypothetical protein
MNKPKIEATNPERPPALAGATGSEKIMHHGYIIELANGGPWLRNDLTWTPIWDERGVWHEFIDAELAMASSLSPNDPDELPPPRDA